MDLLQSLIEGPCVLERVRDRVAEILAAESENQQQKAIAAGKDPELWKLRVYVEAASCWGMFSPREEGNELSSPVVNVWFHKTEYDPKRSLPAVRQQSDTSIGIDIYATACSTDTDDGHIPGDVAARLERERVYGLVYRILMAGTNANLQMPGVVGDHWLSAYEAMERSSDDRDNNQVEQIAAGRCALTVSFNELSPEYVGEALEQFVVGVKRRETGEIYVTANITGA